MYEQRLVDPGSGVRDLGMPARALPLQRTVDGEWSEPMYVPEHHPIGVDSESMHDSR
jgi:hypothetical protein